MHVRTIALADTSQLLYKVDEVTTSTVCRGELLKSSSAASMQPPLAANISGETPT